jgi:hypothetical protein
VKIQFRSLFMAAFALLLVLAGIGAPPGPAPAAPKPTPTATFAIESEVVEPEPFYFDGLDPADYAIPEWMLDKKYLDALPGHDIRKDPANRESADFKAAYAMYVKAMTARGQADGVVTEEQFWQSFFPGGWNHVLTGFRDYKGAKSWRIWLESTIEVSNRSKFGAGYEGHYNVKNDVDAEHGYEAVNESVDGVSLTWKRDSKKHKAGDKRVYRVDSYHPEPPRARRGVVGERKSGSTLNRDELLNVTVEVAAAKNSDIEITFGDNPNKNAEKAMERARELLRARQLALHPGETTQPTVTAKLWRAEGIANRPASAGSLVAGAQQPWPSKAADQVANSAGSAAAAKQKEEIKKAVAEDLADTAEGETVPAKICQLGKAPCRPDLSATEVPAVVYDDELGDDTAEQLGGVDFSTLELRYISDTYIGAPGVKYAYRVDPDPEQQISYGGADAAKLASDSFFTWLALPETAFTVNLNPEEPNRIVDARFGRTDAGRVLLEADFQMKKTVAKLIHPDTRGGKRFWDGLRGEQSCINMRQWIVPKPASVRDGGNELFILDTPLDVKMETELENLSGTQTCPGQAAADTAHNDRLYRAEILPQIIKAVNTAPEYADLRRVYASRVAAQWYRERSATKTTAYADIVDSGDITPWATTTRWKPKDTFDAYVNSYKKGEFRVKRTTRKGNYIYTNTYVYGGVDFTATPTSKVAEAEFAAKQPGLRDAVGDLATAATADESGTLWFGQESNELPRAEALALPASPLSSPWFYALTLLPVLAWAATGLLIVRRRRAAAR